MPEAFICRSAERSERMRRRPAAGRVADDPSAKRPQETFCLATEISNGAAKIVPRAYFAQGGA